MPQVTVYIREEDIDKWKSLEKKSEFIHYALATVSPEGIKVHKEVFGRELSPGVQDTLNAAKQMDVDSLKIPGVVRASELKVCKIHGIPLTTQGKCMQKGCKYA